jgi:hypothetical protein
MVHRLSLTSPADVKCWARMTEPLTVVWCRFRVWPPGLISCVSVATRLPSGGIGAGAASGGDSSQVAGRGQHMRQLHRPAGPVLGCARDLPGSISAQQAWHRCQRARIPGCRLAGH